MIMRNHFSWQMQVINSVIHIFIIWLGYIYRTSSWYPSSCGTILKERITEADWIAALEASLFWAKEYNIELEKQQYNLGQIHHMHSHIYLLSEKGLVFYLYLQKFHMDFSLSTVTFATDNFDKRKFFLDTLYLWCCFYRWPNCSPSLESMVPSSANW